MSLLSKISFQLYSSRNFPPLENQLAILEKLGFQNVEPFGGLYEDLSGFAAMVNAHHLKVPTGHFGIEMLEQNFAGAVEIARILQMKTMICPYIVPEQRPADAKGWESFAARLSAIRKNASAEGFGFGWHNHDFEFFRLADGRLPMDMIMGADDELLWEADAGWIARAGEDPVHWLEKYAGRVRVVHVKDIAAPATPVVEDGWADVGHGQQDWSKIIPAGLKAGAEVLVFEHDNPADFERFARRSMETAKGWNF